MTVTRIWHRTDQVELASAPTAAFQARQRAARCCALWRLPDVVETVELLVSELVTNAVKANEARSVGGVPFQPVAPVFRDQKIKLRFASDDTQLLVEVWDSIKEPPILRDVTNIENLDNVESLADTGRGLVLVDRLASIWGYHFPDQGGKIVWLLVDLCSTRK